MENPGMRAPIENAAQRYAPWLRSSRRHASGRRISTLGWDGGTLGNAVTGLYDLTQGFA